MSKAFAAVALATALVAGPVLAAPAEAMTPRLITGPYVSGWFGYWEPDSVVQALADKGTSTVPEVNIFWWSFAGPERPLCTYNTDSSCSTESWTNTHLDEQRLILQEAGIPVLGSIVDGSAATALSTYLSSAATRTAYADQIVDWTVKAGLDGVDLDWEKFAFTTADQEIWPQTKPRWVAFVKQLGSKLRQRGLVLSVTVPAGSRPFLSDGRPNPGTGYWVYAWDEIIGSVDRLRLMAYDYSYTSPGPIGPYPWANEVTRSALAQVATETPSNRKKVWLGIPQYSRNWVRQAGSSYVTRGDCPADWKPVAGASGIPGMLSQSIQRALEIAAREQVTPTWDATYGEYTYRYWIDTDGTAGGTAVRCNAEREVWFADTRSAKLKANIVRDQGIAGLAVWEFGFVLDGFYSEMARKIAPPLELRASFDNRIRKGESTKVYGKVLRGDKAVEGARVSVTWISTSGNKRDLGATRTTAKGKYTVKVTPPKSGTLRITATSQGQKVIIKRAIAVDG